MSQIDKPQIQIKYRHSVFATLVILVVLTLMFTWTQFRTASSSLQDIPADSFARRFLYYANPANATGERRAVRNMRPGIYRSFHEAPRPLACSPDRPVGIWHFNLSSAIFNDGTNCRDPLWSMYVEPVMRLLDSSSVRLSDSRTYATLFVGDCTLRLLRRTLTKSRQRGDVNGVLLPLNFRRHWKDLHDFHDPTPYEKKHDKIVWRGITTGTPRSLYDGKTVRHFFVEWCLQHPKPYVDVGFNEIVQNSVLLQNLTVQSLTRSQLLKNKFLVFLEGNDVPTGLKWGLMSNSVVFMPSPTYASWLMEDVLVPWVHFVPLNDTFSDLHTKYEWAMSHPNECKVITSNANRFMQQFKDRRIERALSQNVFNFYLEHDLVPYEDEDGGFVPQAN